MYNALVFIFGLIMGSFLGVIIDRLPKKAPIATGRSRCEFCNRNLSPLELIPIISYFNQGGKCRQCKTKLSLRYPLLELITGTTYLLGYMKFGYSIDLVFALIFTSILIIITFIDIDTMIIYDRFHIIIMLIGIIAAILLNKNYINVVLASLIISVPLLIIANLTGGMGGGDIKLMFASGIYLGINNIIVAFIISVILGGIYGMLTLVGKKHKRSDAIPFGPFLCIGLFTALIYGQQIGTWYLSLLIR